jgi:hypothetical protein
MDPQHITDLEELAGLKLTPAQRQALAGDLASLARHAAGILSAAPYDKEQIPPPGPAPLSDLEPAPMERPLVEANAPDYAAGFFQVPAVDTTSDQERE